jgi:hypothetical protein
MSYPDYHERVKSQFSNCTGLIINVQKNVQRSRTVCNVSLCLALFILLALVLAALKDHVWITGCMAWILPEGLLLLFFSMCSALDTLQEISTDLGYLRSSLPGRDDEGGRNGA